ncbi:MAG: hypothetical protein WDN75_14865 [Bacteroidota bacterium]
MQDRFQFYKDSYYRELDKQAEINASLSLPIGLITAFVAGLYYLLSNFNFSFAGWTMTFFLVATIGAIAFLLTSVYHLIMCYNKIPHGYTYLQIADAQAIEDYYESLTNHYINNPDEAGNTKQETQEYVTLEMIKNTDANQKNNKEKVKFRYNSEKWLIRSFLAICLSLPFFGMNFSQTPKKKNSN